MVQCTVVCNSPLMALPSVMVPEKSLDPGTTQTEADAAIGIGLHGAGQHGDIPAAMQISSEYQFTSRAGVLCVGAYKWWRWFRPRQLHRPWSMTVAVVPNVAPIVPPAKVNGPVKPTPVTMVAAGSRQLAHCRSKPPLRQWE